MSAVDGTVNQVTVGLTDSTTSAEHATDLGVWAELIGQTTAVATLQRAVAADPLIGKMRSLERPRQRTCSLSRRRSSMFNATNSLTRIPVAYNNSSMALSRNASGPAWRSGS